MKKLQEYLREAKNSHYAIGHINFATEDVLRAIVEASIQEDAPCVLVGTSEGEAEFFGVREAVAVVKAMREHFNFPVFLNADHFKSFDKCKEAIDAGYDSVIIDPAQSLSADRQKKGQTLSGASTSIYDEKIAITKKTVEYAKSINPDITVEGELGYLKGSSEVQQKVEISVEDYTKPEMARDFVSKTGVGRLAVVFGNIHGIVTEQEEKLDVEHFKKIVSVVAACLPAGREVDYVLHGASGLADQDVRAAIQAGINNVHFNTELRVAYQHSIAKTLQEKPKETTPYKYLGPADEEVKKVVSAKIKMFMGN